MGRGLTFSLIEEELIMDNADLTTAELEELLRSQGYHRSRKSIARKLEKLREEGKVGLRSRSTRSRALDRRQWQKKPEQVDPDQPTQSFKDLEGFSGESFDTGNGSFDGGSSFYDEEE